MDNIGKLVLGLVAFIGLIILLIPEGNPLQDKGETAVAEAPKNLPPPDNGDDGEGEVAPGEAPAPAPVQPTTSNDAIAFGQPMMDPTPPAQRALQQQLQQQQQQQQQPGYEGPEEDDANTSGPAMPGAPTNYGFQPQPVPGGPFPQ